MLPLRFLLTLIAIFLTIFYTNGDETNIKTTTTMTTLRNLPHTISGDLISLKFYGALRMAESAKTALQSQLQNFLEHLQRNLTTSMVFNANAINNDNKIQNQKQQQQKIINLWKYFEEAAIKVEHFTKNLEFAFEASKNESYALVQKLRQVTAGQRSLGMHVKQQLTNYYVEMEFMHILFCELIDEVLEYALHELHTTQHTFNNYKDIQREVYLNWQFNATDICYTRYIHFLHHWSAHIFKCSTDDRLQTIYDVYAVTVYTIRHVLQQIEFRLNRLFSCFNFGQLGIRCRFLQLPELDFEPLRSKLDDLQVYFDIRAKHGLVTPNRHRHQRKRRDQTHLIYDKCLPYGFPDTQMMSNLKICFNFHQLNSNT